MSTDSKFSVKLELDAQAKATLKRMASSEVRIIAANAARKPLSVVRKRAMASCPKRFGFLRDAITIRVKYYPRYSFLWTGVGISKTASHEYSVNGVENQIARPVKYAHLVEFGHGGRGSHAAPKPFMRPAANSLGDMGEKLVGDAIMKGISKMIRKAKK